MVQKTGVDLPDETYYAKFGVSSLRKKIFGGRNKFVVFTVKLTTLLSYRGPGALCIRVVRASVLRRSPTVRPDCRRLLVSNAFIRSSCIRTLRSRFIAFGSHQIGLLIDEAMAVELRRLDELHLIF